MQNKNVKINTFLAKKSVEAITYNWLNWSGKSACQRDSGESPLDRTRSGWCGWSRGQCRQGRRELGDWTAEVGCDAHLVPPWRRCPVSKCEPHSCRANLGTIFDCGWTVDAHQSSFGEMSAELSIHPSGRQCFPLIATGSLPLPALV